MSRVMSKKLNKKQRTNQRKAAKKMKDEVTVNLYTQNEDFFCDDEHLMNLQACQRRSRIRMFRSYVQFDSDNWEDHLLDSKDQYDSDNWEDHLLDSNDQYDSDNWEDHRYDSNVRCNCSWSNHSNPYFCDDNWRQREHDSEDAFRRAD
jgi:hypothetical protein